MGIMTNPLEGLTRNQKFLAWAGIPGLALLMILARPYFQQSGNATQTGQGDLTALTSFLDVKLEAHVNQTAADQRVLVEKLTVIEDLTRELVDQMRTANALNRQQNQFQRCLTLARNDDATRACAGVIR